MSKSPNVNEANIALRQARKLIDKYNLESSDIAAFDVSQFRLSIGKRPSNWAIKHGNVCANAFGCIVLICKSLSYDGIQTELNFIGVGSYPELARYAYDVLGRQLSKARHEFVSGLSSRCKLATKRRRGDTFAEAWIQAVHKLVAEYSGCDEESLSAIDEYTKLHFPDIKTLELKPKRLLLKDLSASEMGHQSGLKATLYKPVGNQVSPKIEVGKALAQLCLL